MLPLVGLQCAIVGFPDHNHLIFLETPTRVMVGPAKDKPRNCTTPKGFMSGPSLSPRPGPLLCN